MEYENEKWLNDVLTSMKGSARAVPPTDLYARIEGRIGQKHARIIPLRQLRLAGVAACFLILVNAFAIYYDVQGAGVEMSGQLVEDLDLPQYGTNYQIYER